MDIDEHLCGYDQVLDFFGFGGWHLVSRREIAGPNWKVAYDGYLDFYHLPFLHRNIVRPGHQQQGDLPRVGPAPAGDVARPGAASSLRDLPEDEWDLDRICGGVWTIFPHVSFAGGNGGGLISQLFPGPTPGDVGHGAELLRRRRAVRRAPRRGGGRRPTSSSSVVRDEDYYTGLRLQRALATGAKPRRAVRPQRGRRAALPHAARQLRRRRARQPQLNQSSWRGVSSTFRLVRPRSMKLGK